MFGPSLNPNTGDYSVGVSGFWFENGERAYPVSEVTVAGDLPAMLLRAIPGSRPRNPRLDQRTQPPDRWDGPCRAVTTLDADLALIAGRRAREGVAREAGGLALDMMREGAGRGTSRPTIPSPKRTSPVNDLIARTPAYARVPNMAGSPKRRRTMPADRSQDARLRGRSDRRHQGVREGRDRLLRLDRACSMTARRSRASSTIRISTSCCTPVSRAAAFLNGARSGSTQTATASAAA